MEPCPQESPGWEKAHVSSEPGRKQEVALAFHMPVPRPRVCWTCENTELWDRGRHVTTPPSITVRAMIENVSRAWVVL